MTLDHAHPSRYHTPPHPHTHTRAHTHLFRRRLRARGLLDLRLQPLRILGGGDARRVRSQFGGASGVVERGDAGDERGAGLCAVGGVGGVGWEAGG